eukprot:244358-Hanusia_phi.AAC.1
MPSCVRKERSNKNKALSSLACSSSQLSTHLSNMEDKLSSSRSAILFSSMSSERTCGGEERR